jgi:hypothetical protein
MTVGELIDKLNTFHHGDEVVTQGWDAYTDEWVTYDSLDISYYENEHKVVIT